MTTSKDELKTEIIDALMVQYLDNLKLDLTIGEAEQKATKALDDYCQQQLLAALEGLKERKQLYGHHGEVNKAVPISEIDATIERVKGNQV